MTTPAAVTYLIDLSGYTEAELNQIRSDVLVELDRRSKLSSIPQVMADLNKQYLDADGVTPGQEWTQPNGAHDAYPLDWTVTYNGKTWTSLVAGNVWEPGVANWRELPAAGELAEWIQPTGATDAYKLGDRVTHNGQNWTSDVDANVWEPGVSEWTADAPPAPAVAEWVQPTGATDAYAKGSHVMHNSTEWTSDVDANVWEPGVYGWTAV